MQQTSHGRPVVGEAAYVAFGFSQPQSTFQSGQGIGTFAPLPVGQSL